MVLMSATASRLTCSFIRSRKWGSAWATSCIRWRILSRIFLAAASVKVTNSIRSTVARPSLIRSTARLTSTAVFPEPADADTIMFWSRSLIACCWAGVGLKSAITCLLSLHRRRPAGRIRPGPNGGPAAGNSAGRACYQTGKYHRSRCSRGRFANYCRSVSGTA